MNRSMKVITLAATLALTFSLSAQTQTQPPPTGTAPQDASSNGPSVLMAVELSKSLDSKKAKAGDQVEAKTMQDMKAPNGTDIPRGSKVIGHVTHAAAHTKDQPQAQLGFVFEKIVTKSGQEFPLRGVLQAVSVPENAPPNAGGGLGPGSVGAQQAGPGGRQQQPGMAGQAGSQGGQSGMAGAGSQGGAAATSEGNPMGAPTASPARSGVTGLQDVQLASGPEPALNSSARNIHLDSGSVITVKVVPTAQQR